VPAPLEDSLTIPSQLEEIDSARRWLAAHARAEGVSEAQVSDLELAVTEVVSNVIRHGYAGAAGREVKLTLAIDNEEVRIEVIDSAAEFDPTREAPGVPDVPAEGGFGVHLVEQLMDEVTHESGVGGGNVLTLRLQRR